MPGDIIRYHIEFQSRSQTKHTGAVQDPQGPSLLTVTWNATLRVQVLDQANALNTPGKPIRLRTVYEKSAATVQSDTPDPASEGIERQYAQLEGQSMEFTIGGDGQISDIRGLEGILSEENARKAAEQWMMQFSSTASAPAGDILPGQSWTSDQHADLPLDGLVWRSQSTYLRNESCHAGGGPAAATQTQLHESCAVILTRLSLVQPQRVKDATPEEYRRNALHTAGHWTGSGESLTYVSLKNGWVVSVTQTGTEQMDVTVSSADGTNVGIAGMVSTSSGVSLLPATDPP